ncbi:hypothetical protein FDECE_10405 [Fusarium decemcellulare]|nr:hypothetical protein FDECE_10405 [Fusarium decemcellulare]
MVDEAATNGELPPFNHLQKAFSISALDIPKNENGRTIFQGYDRLAASPGFGNSVHAPPGFENSLPPLAASSIRVLILEQVGETGTMEVWTSTPQSLSDVSTLRNLWAGPILCDSSRAFCVCNYTALEPEIQRRRVRDDILPRENPFYATRVYPQTIEGEAMAVTLDILRASVECWATFLSDLINGIHDLSTQQKWLRSRHSPVTRDIPVAVSHLELVLRHTCACFLAKVKDTHGVDKARLSSLEQEMNAKLGMLQIQVQQVLGMSATYTDEVQGKSVQRLSLLATIFLPVSLASSLLSMNVRAADLGPLWYDYFGLAVIAIVLVVLLYRCSIGTSSLA